MSADMKTLREALRWACPPDKEERLLASALDELEALRVAAGPAGDIISGVLNERLAAAEAQRDELLAALVRLRELTAPEFVGEDEAVPGCCEDCDAALAADAAIAKARGGK